MPIFELGLRRGDRFQVGPASQARSWLTYSGGALDKPYGSLLLCRLLQNWTTPKQRPERITKSRVHPIHTLTPCILPIRAFSHQPAHPSIHTQPSIWSPFKKAISHFQGQNWKQHFVFNLLLLKNVGGILISPKWPHKYQDSFPDGFATNARMLNLTLHTSMLLWQVLDEPTRCLSYFIENHKNLITLATSVEQHQTIPIRAALNS